MFAPLNAALGWGDTPSVTENFILVTDSTQADGGFVLSHLVHLFLKARQSVTFVGLDQSFFHYFSVSRKLGVNLRTAHGEKQYSFINALSAPYDWTDDISVESTNDQLLALQSIANANPFSLQTKAEAPLKSLFDQIKRSVEPKTHPCLVVLDNVNILAIATSEYEVVQFIQQLKVYLASRPAPGLLVALAHSDETDSQLVRSLVHRSDLTVLVSGFRLGQSKDADGVVSFINNQPGKYDFKLPELQYKASENGVALTSIRRDSYGHKFLA